MTTLGRGGSNATLVAIGAVLKAEVCENFTDVAGISEGRVQLRAGTLYTALDRLKADGLIDVDREEIVDNRLRRYYRLPPEGGRRLSAEAARLQANARAAIRRLNPALGAI